MVAQRNLSLASLFANALLVVPDGMPTVWMGHLQGLRMMERVFGPDLMLAVVSRSQFTGWSHFLCGGDQGVAEQLGDVLTSRFPSIKLVGTYTPPYRPLNEVEQSTFIRMIDRCRPDIIWVGLSTPKQEQFMAKYLPLVNTTLMIGVGAAFDYHTGRIKDSPSWIKQTGLQWFHRLMQEPRRLWKRYLFNNPSFLFHAALQLTELKRYELPSSGGAVPVEGVVVHQV